MDNPDRYFSNEKLALALVCATESGKQSLADLGRCVQLVKTGGSWVTAEIVFSLGAWNRARCVADAFNALPEAQGYHACVSPSYTGPRGEAQRQPVVVIRRQIG